MSSADSATSNENPSITLPGTVEKLIKPIHPSQSEKIQVAVEGADDLYREIRIDNALQDQNGETVALKQGVQVEVTVDAKPQDTTPIP